MLLYYSRAAFAKDFQLGYAGNIYKFTNLTWCIISIIYVNETVNYDMLRE